MIAPTTVRPPLEGPADETLERDGEPAFIAKLRELALRSLRTGLVILDAIARWERRNGRQLDVVRATSPDASDPAGRAQKGVAN